MDKKLTKQLKKRGLRAGADAVGLADADVLKKMFPRDDATQFLKGARCVVVALVADPPAVRAAADINEYLGLAFPGYQRADGAMNSMRRFLDRKGHQTHFVVREWHRARDRRGRGAMTLSLKNAAQAAGLGHTGLHTLLITPEHGPRVRLSGFITDAPLVPDKPYKKNLCDDCGACVEACPSGAISRDKPFSMTACSAYLFAGVSVPEIETAMETRDMKLIGDNARRVGKSAKGWIDSMAAGRRLYYNCGNCIRVCNGHRHAQA